MSVIPSSNAHRWVGIVVLRACAHNVCPQVGITSLLWRYMSVLVLNKVSSCRWLTFKSVRLNTLSMASCQKGPTRHANAWQIGPFWQDTLVISNSLSKLTPTKINIKASHYHFLLWETIDIWGSHRSLVGDQWIFPPKRASNAKSVFMSPSRDNHCFHC